MKNKKPYELITIPDNIYMLLACRVPYICEQYMEFRAQKKYIYIHVFVKIYNLYIGENCFKSPI